MPKPPGREISIISDWGSGIKLSADEDGLPEKIGFFLVGPTFSSWLNLKVRTHGNQQNLLTVCLWKTTSQFHRYFERFRIPERLTWQNNWSQLYGIYEGIYGFLSRFPPASFNVPVLERSLARERAIGLPG